MNQSLLTFEQAIVEAEAAKCEAQRAAECHEREAKHAAKILAASQREKRKAEEEAAKSWRRFQRDAVRRERTPHEHAQCGIRWTTIREANSMTWGSHLVAGLGSQLPQPARPRPRMLLDSLPRLRPGPHLHLRPER